MKFRKALFSLTIPLISVHLFAQLPSDTPSVYHFTKALYLRAANRYGREAVYTDEIAYRLNTNTLKTPAEGDTLGQDEHNRNLIWQAVTADSSRTLALRETGRRGFGRNGYTYLTYMSSKTQTALLNIKGNSSVFCNEALHAGDPYSSGWLYVPVKLQKGLNEFYVRGGYIVADLIFPSKPILLNTEDATLPSIVQGFANSDLMGAVVLINTTGKELKGLKIKATITNKTTTADVPEIRAMSSRKIIFHFDGSEINNKGKYECILKIISGNKFLDEKKIILESVNAGDTYCNTFISDIDGSLQYYAVTPQLPAVRGGAALFLSVHGAGVEAIGQARAYASKDWGTLVAATNRRPRGFNWEDWGRLDALEVLNIAKQEFKPDPQHIYLTGHSMGGHGTWFLGATYPDKWAAIGACSGYPTLKGYGSADGLIPDTATSPMEQMLLRSGNQSVVVRLASNYKPLGVYILHGDSDSVVSVKYARQMRKILGDYQTDFSYYEYPGGAHWFGNQSVDWKPLFDFFKWHRLLPDSIADEVDFTTANPGISCCYRWAAIQQQQYPLQYSRMQLKRNKSNKTISGTTENIRLIKLQLKDFGAGVRVKILLDSSDAVAYNTLTAGDSIYLVKERGKWMLSSTPSADKKNPHRYGTFKDAFNHRMIFIYGTNGTKEENEWSFNKARYDAETWYYRGNGAVDMIADKEFSLAKYRDRGIILYGNSNTNGAWKMLLNECPIQVKRNQILAGNKIWNGDDMAACFVWPLHNSDIASVGVIAGTGLNGMKAANGNQYFAGASGFPDFMIYKSTMLQSGASGVKLAGFFDNNWRLDEANMVQAN